MYYPEFLKNGDIVGISAPSAGVGRKLESFDASLNVLKHEGYQIRETASVRVNDVRSASPEIRGKEWNELIADPDTAFVMAAAGGDFLFEILPYVDWEAMKQHPKWIMGASDPTSLLFAQTTLNDIASIYGNNAGSFDEVPLHASLTRALELIRGERKELQSFDFISSTPPFSDEPLNYDKPSRWECCRDSLQVSGRCIGGCMDVLKDVIGTRYDGMKEFNRRYAEDGTIFFLDNFALSAEMFYNTLLQMRYAGWFDHTKAVLVGRHLFPSSNTGLTYEEALERALKDIPYVTEADIGHTKPSLPLIMGAMLDLNWHDGKAVLKFRLD